MSELLYKVLLWRFVSVLSMVATLWILTGDLIESTGVTLVVQVVQTLVHATFETWWTKHRVKKGS